MKENLKNAKYTFNNQTTKPTLIKDIFLEYILKFNPLCFPSDDAADFGVILVHESAILTTNGAAPHNQSDIWWGNYRLASFWKPSGSLWERLMMKGKILIILPRSKKPFRQNYLSQQQRS